MKKVLLRLYVNGETPRTLAAINQMQQNFSKELLEEMALEVIDVLKNPDLAVDDQVLATPTLIKKLPEPIRRVIGDFSNKEKVLVGLDLLGG